MSRDSSNERTRLTREIGWSEVFEEAFADFKIRNAEDVDAGFLHIFYREVASLEEHCRWRGAERVAGRQ